jgi:hypothetical protein
MRKENNFFLGGRWRVILVPIFRVRKKYCYLKNKKNYIQKLVLGPQKIHFPNPIFSLLEKRFPKIYNTCGLSLKSIEA